MRYVLIICLCCTYTIYGSNIPRDNIQITNGVYKKNITSLPNKDNSKNFGLKAFIQTQNIVFPDLKEISNKISQLKMKDTNIGISYEEKEDFSIFFFKCETHSILVNSIYSIY